MRSLVKRYQQRRQTYEVRGDSFNEEAMVGAMRSKQEARSLSFFLSHEREIGGTKLGWLLDQVKRKTYTGLA